MKQKLLSGLFFMAFLILSQLGFSQSVFINELHYDNISGDLNEGVEIAGPAGTDLTDWQIVLYNGSATQLKEYGSISLSGIIPDQSNGFGTIYFPKSSIQNGDPDGLALVDAGGNLIQFLSYGGTFIPIDGPAAGIESTDIKVTEDGDVTPADYSLQLSGNGTLYADFTWQEPQSSTFRSINNGQTFGDAIETISIAEARTLPEGTEVTVSGILTVSDQFGGPAYIQDATGGIAVYDSQIHGAGNYQIGDRLYITASTTSYNQLIELENVTEITASGQGSITPAEISLSQLENYRGQLVTITDVNFTDAGSNFSGNTNYDISDASGSGQLRVDADVSSVIGETIPESCTSITAVVGRYNSTNQLLVRNVDDFGCDLSGNTGGPGEGNLVINEVDADTPGGDELEFVEIFDGGNGNTSLNGYTLVFYNGSGPSSNHSFDLDGYATDENGYFVIGNPSVANVDYVIDPGTIQNGADAVALYKADASDFPNGTEITTTGLVDAFVYDTNDSDIPALLDLLVSGGQVNEDGAGDKDNHSSQRYPNGSGDLRSTLTYLQAIPTPGYENTNRTEAVTIVINELDADTEGTDSEEFLELYDGGDGNTSLDGLVLVLYNGSNNESYKAIDLSGYATDENGYFVIGNAAVENVDLIVPGNTFQNGADAAVVYYGMASDFPNGSPVSLNNIVDAIVYGTGDATDEDLLPLLNSGQEQLDEDANNNKNSESLQRIPNGEGGARNTSSFLALIPTPGTENVEIASHGELISIAEARTKTDGETVTVQGTLTVTDQFYGPAYLQDETGAIAIYDKTVYGDNLFEIGTAIKITAQKTTYNGQIELIDAVRVDDLGPAANPVQPLEITLDQLSNHPDELVTITNISFADDEVGKPIFGNQNFNISDESGAGILRIDNGTTDLLYKAIPESCGSITGIAADVYFNIIPRNLEDFPCVNAYDGDNGLDVPFSETLDVVAWNLEFFGFYNETGDSKAPAPAEIQKEAVKSRIIQLNADLIAVEEVVNVDLFAEMVSELDGYDYILSDAVSYPNNPDDSFGTQRVGFIYKKDVISIKDSKALLESIHPYYNGDDESYLTDYPTGTSSQFWASGRLPFLIETQVTSNGKTKDYDFVVIHAKSGSAAEDYQRREYDNAVLKDSLDTYYANANLVLLGDYNDDVDQTIADTYATESSYYQFVNDEDYWVVTSSLSEEGLKSTISFSDMIDHIAISDELYDNYLEGSANVRYDLYTSDYASTTSDHFPVSARFILFDGAENAKNNPDMVQVCMNGHPQFVSENAVDALLKKGAVLGSCEGSGTSVSAVPNPVFSETSISVENFKNGKAQLTIYNLSGNVVLTDKILVKNGSADYDLNMSSFISGMYIVEVKNGFGQISYTKIIKK